MMARQLICTHAQCVMRARAREFNQADPGVRAARQIFLVRFGSERFLLSCSSMRFDESSTRSNLCVCVCVCACVCEREVCVQLELCLCLITGSATSRGPSSKKFGGKLKQ